MQAPGSPPGTEEEQEPTGKRPETRTGARRRVVGGESSGIEVARRGKKSPCMGLCGPGPWGLAGYLPVDQYGGDHGYYHAYDAGCYAYHR
ncbi:hypothetical protein PABY_19290 [Pyrodictium abyssi]|uniref:Uncharacterized protein n=1 Tax=Pyrodictium abyssi TaxID=54256 RepID=A0ABM8IZU6_9CREN|nr:hypothetical protein PABY_19290 [Pyrodictium abyssi]